jgi:hypothetical protein
MITPSRQTPNKKETPDKFIHPDMLARLFITPFPEKFEMHTRLSATRTQAVPQK